MRAGALCRSKAVREAFVSALKESGLDRDYVAAEMSRLTGEAVSVTHLNNWCGESKQEWRLPLEYASAFCLIVEDWGVFVAALEGTGRELADKQVMLAAEYGRLVAEKKKRAVKERELLEAMS